MQGVCQFRRGPKKRVEIGLFPGILAGNAAYFFQTAPNRPADNCLKCTQVLPPKATCLAELAGGRDYDGILQAALPAASSFSRPFILPFETDCPLAASQ